MIKLILRFLGASEPVVAKPADLLAFERAQERNAKCAASVGEQTDILGELVKHLKGNTTVARRKTSKRLKTS